MSDKIVVVGGCGGIGRALVSTLQAAGKDVTVCDLAASIAAHPLDCQTIEIDVCSPDKIEEAMGQSDNTGVKLHHSPE